MRVVQAPPRQLDDDLHRRDAEALIEEARRRQRHRRYSIVGVSIAVIAALVGFLSVSGTNAPPKGHASTGVAASGSGPSVDAQAFHDHGDLAFVSRNTLYVLDGSTNKLRTVVSEAQTAAAPNFPVFSPNGKWLAYSIGESGAGVARADGAAPQVVTTSTNRPQWMPNGDLLIGTTLYRIPASGRAITVGSVSSGLVAWATDGSSYAFVTRSITDGPNGSFRGVVNAHRKRQHP